MTRDGLTGITIRNEAARNFSEVERLTREAFWNVHVPGCGEHYLAHILRTHGDFVPELDLVAEAGGRKPGAHGGRKLFVFSFGHAIIRHVQNILCYYPFYFERGFYGVCE